MELSNTAKQNMIGAKIVKIEDGLIIFDNRQSIVLTEEEIKSLNFNF